MNALYCALLQKIRVGATQRVFFSFVPYETCLKSRACTSFRLCPSMMPNCRRGKHRNGDPETPNTKHLENQSSTLRLLVTTKLEVLASLQRQLELGLALDTLQSQNNLLGSLSLLVEDRLGLTTITGLLAVVSALTLGE